MGASGPESSQEVSGLSVHVAVDGEELALRQDGEELTEGGLATPVDTQCSLLLALK